MNVTEVLSNIIAAQATLQALSVLQLTTYLWPEQAVVQDGSTYDMIIVGAGTAGCVLASRLTEVPELNVLLIEAGGDPPLEAMLPGLSYYVINSHMDWNYTSEPNIYSSPTHKDFRQTLPRGKMLGGSSSTNFMAYSRGSPEDYNSWATIVEDPSWNYMNILPYFIKSERFDNKEIMETKYGVIHGTEGYLGVSLSLKEGTKRYLDAFEEIGYEIKLDVTGNDTLGFALDTFTIANGVRQSTAYSYLSPIKDRPNLHVLKNALVSKIIFEDKKAVGVQIILNDKTITVKANKEIIISAGAINTPQLLMLSGVGPRSHLETFGIDVISDLPVGQNLQDHVPVMVYFKMDKEESFHKPRNPQKFATPTVAGYVALNKNQNYPDYQIKVHLNKHDTPGIVQYCSFVVGFQDEICQVLGDITGRNIISVLLAHLHPKSRGEIHLRSNNPKDYPIIDLAYFSNEDDVKDLAKYLQDFVRIANSTYFRAVEAEMVDFNLPACINLTDLEYWKCYTRHLRISQWHYCGTSALGTVVDSKLKVKGVQNLRVADASIMPTLPSGNTNVPTIMIAEKAAAIIINDNDFEIEEDWLV